MNTTDAALETHPYVRNILHTQGACKACGKGPILHDFGGDIVARIAACKAIGAPRELLNALIEKHYRDAK